MRAVQKLIELREDLLQLDNSLDYLETLGKMPVEDVDFKAEMRAIRITRKNKVREIKDKVDNIIKEELDKYE